MKEKLLIIFVKNSELGKVKTRLAASIGDHQALKVYQLLLIHTKEIAQEIDANKEVHYSNQLDFDDCFDSIEFVKDVQEGNNLGERMKNSFAKSFSEEFEKVILIGSDCYELTPEIVDDAFLELEFKDVVIGPAKDGGYYLIGMKKTHEFLFQNKEWSTENVLTDTMLDLKSNGISYTLLETLSDVDTKEDLGEIVNLLNIK